MIRLRIPNVQNCDAFVSFHRGQHIRLPLLALPHGSDASKSSKMNTSTVDLSLC